MTTRELIELVLPIVVSISSALILGAILRWRTKKKLKLDDMLKASEQFLEDYNRLTNPKPQIRVVEEMPREEVQSFSEPKKEKPKLGQRKISFINP